MVVGYLANKECQGIINKIEIQPTLGELKEIYQISRGEEGSKSNIQEDQEGSFFIVIPNDIKRHEVLTGKKIKGSKLTPGKLKSIYTKRKIWVIRIQKMRWKQRIVCSLDERINSAAMKTLQSITLVDGPLEQLTYLSAILNSKLINFWCINYLADDLNQSYLSQIPIVPPTSCGDLLLKTLSSLVVSISTMKMSTTIRTPVEANQLQQAITTAEDTIDNLVYQLYGLTDEEIKIIEAQC